MNSTDVRLRELELRDTGSLTSHMTSEEAAFYLEGVPTKQRETCIRRMKDEELQAAIAYVQARLACDVMKNKPGRKK